MLDPDRRIDVDGLVYTSVTDSSWRQWRHVLRRHASGRFAIAVRWLWGALAGYGYRAGRTALASGTGW